MTSQWSNQYVNRYWDRHHTTSSHAERNRRMRVSSVAAPKPGSRMKKFHNFQSVPYRPPSIHTISRGVTCIVRAQPRLALCCTQDRQAVSSSAEIVIFGHDSHLKMSVLCRRRQMTVVYGPGVWMKFPTTRRPSTARDLSIRDGTVSGRYDNK